MLDAKPPAMLKIPQRLFAVETHYQPGNPANLVDEAAQVIFIILSIKHSSGYNLLVHVVAHVLQLAMDALKTLPSGHVLVFLPTRREAELACTIVNTQTHSTASFA
jgi:HrpA-like RNA helicase